MHKAKKRRTARKKNNHKNQLEDITTKIIENEQKLSLNLRINTTTAINQGGNILVLEKLLEKNGGNFDKHRKKRFPHLRTRTIQRYKRLAEHVNLKDYPVLKVISQRKLNKLITLNKKNDVGEYLLRNDFNLDFDPTDFEASKILIAQIATFIKHKKKSKKRNNGSLSPSIRETVSIICDYVEEKISEKSSISDIEKPDFEKLFDLLSDLFYTDEDDE